jgi:hypothetical protein
MLGTHIPIKERNRPLALGRAQVAIFSIMVDVIDIEITDFEIVSRQKGSTGCAIMAVNPVKLVKVNDRHAHRHAC